MPIPIWAGRYIGLPFRAHGRGREGLDCWGLVRLVMAEQFSVPLPSFVMDYQSPFDSKSVAQLIDVQCKSWRSVKAGSERCGDVIVLRIRGLPTHVGIVLGDQHMLHIERSIDSAIERYDRHQWKNRVHGFYRHHSL